MAYRHNQHIDSPTFKEYAYRALKNSTPEQRDGLPWEEKKIFLSDYTLQKFCKEERMDHVMYMLTRIGISWTFRIEIDAVAADMLEFNTEDQYKYPQKRVDGIEATAREGVCVISSRDVMNWSHIVAQNCANKVYHISDFNVALEKKGRDFKQLKSWDIEMAKVQQAHDIFNSVLLEQLNAFEYAKNSMGLEVDDIRVLLALYSKRQSAISMADIASLTRSTGKKMYFRQELEKLLSMGLITSDVKDVKKKWANTGYFMISTRGIDKIMKYKEFVFKNVNP